MGIRKMGNKASQYMMKGVTYSDGQKGRTVSGGKSGTGGLKVGRKAGLKADANRTPSSKMSGGVFKNGGRA